MYTINQEYQYEQVIKKSRFICTIVPVNSLEEANDALKRIRKKYYDATHNCYSYIIDEHTIKASDDNEPSQTAGVVILEVLKKNNLTNVLAVVTRYYGGVKLGAGGLIRAYSSTTSATVNTIKPIIIEKLVIVHLSFAYTYANEVKLLVNDYIEISSYGDLVNMTLNIPENIIEEIIQKLINITKNNIIIKK